jgi:hypothetical protein
MNWYISKIVFRIVCGNGEHTPQFDEQLRLIHAADEEQAFQKAQLLGRHEQDSFLNQHKQLVQWQFINISELYKLASITDGIELYSRIQESENASNYMNMIHEKARRIQSSFETPVTLADV